MYKQLLICLFGFVTFLILPPLEGKAGQINESQQLIQASHENFKSDLQPLPGGCRHVTPPGAPEPLCCISGYVYLDGAPMAGAQITLQTSNGDQAVAYTHAYLDHEIPYYRIDLSNKLQVQPGDTITVTASFQALSRTLTYVVRAGGQQLDVVLPRATTAGFQLIRQIQGQAPHGHFNAPTSVALDRSGYVYVVDRENQRIQKLEPNGRFVLQWGAEGRQNGDFFDPDDIAIDRWGNVYVADTQNHRVQKFSGDGAWLATVGQAGTASGAFNEPQGVAVDSAGNLYVADTGNRRIQIFDRNLVWRQTIAMPPTTTLSSTKAVDVAVDGAGNLYVVDSAHRLLKFLPNGQLTYAVGAQGTSNGQLFNPTGVAVDAHSIYVADTDNLRVQIFRQSDGAWQNTWNGDTNPLTSPQDVAIDGDGLVYVADTNQNQVKRFTVDGRIISKFGQKGDRSDVDLNHISDFVLDAQQNLFVIDQTNTVIKVYNADGARQPNWGNTGPPNSSSYGSLAVDEEGRLYALDTQQRRLKRFNGDGIITQQWPIAKIGSGSRLAVQNQALFVSPGQDSREVQEFTTTGITKTVWSYSGAGGIARLAADPSHSLFAIDSADQQIRRLQTDGTWRPWTTPTGTVLQGEAMTTDAAGHIYVTSGNQLRQYTNNGALVATVVITEVGGFSVSKLGALKLGSDGAIYVVDASNPKQRLLVYRPISGGAANGPPLATINHVLATSLAFTGTLQAVGMGQDSDATNTIIAYEWQLAGGRKLGVGAALTLPASELGAGLHTLALRVQDDEGVWSAPATVQLLVAEAVAPTAQWTLLLYLAGDYPDNERLWKRFNTVLADLAAGLQRSNVQIAVQVDGPGNGDTLRRLIRLDANGDVQVINEQAIERAMDNPNQLADFVRWGKKHFPATYYYLVVADHGQATHGIAWDYTSDQEDGVVDHASRLTVKALRQALTQPGVQPIHLLHLDACSMNLLETAYELKDTAQVLIATQYLGWDIFPYVEYANAIDPQITVTQVAQRVVERYAAALDTARVPYTLSALTLNRTPTMIAKLDDLVNRLQALAITTEQLRQVWDQTQKLDSNGDYLNNNLDAYLDLIDWATKIKQNIPAVTGEVDALINTLSEFVLANHRASHRLYPEDRDSPLIDVDNAYGVSIFYPRQRNEQTYTSYSNHTLFSFTQVSRWPSFLAGNGSSPLAPAAAFLPFPTVFRPLSAPTSAQQLFLPIIRR